MDQNKLITSLEDFSQDGDGDIQLDMDMSIIDNLVDLVGDESAVEECAKESFEELKKAFEGESEEMKEGDSAEQLAMAALIVKLVEKGKLGPQEADTFIEDNL